MEGGRERPVEVDRQSAKGPGEESDLGDEERTGEPSASRFSLL